jgi:hypothetical protein
MPRRSKHDLDRLRLNVLDQLALTMGWAQKKGLPSAAVLASALETSVTVLAYNRGPDQMAQLLGELADELRRGQVVEDGWVLERFDSFARGQDSKAKCFR